MRARWSPTRTWWPSIGPQMSGAGKAMTPILSQGGLATITPSSTNPDITNPKFADQYRPAGKPIYFRTVTTDAFQGPNMANFFAEKLKVKSVYVLDDSGAFGVGIADTFQKRGRGRRASRCSVAIGWIRRRPTTRRF